MSLTLAFVSGVSLFVCSQGDLRVAARIVGAIAVSVPVAASQRCHWLGTTVVVHVLSDTFAAEVSGLGSDLVDSTVFETDDS